MLVLVPRSSRSSDVTSAGLGPPRGAGDAAGPPAGTVPCRSSKGQRCGPAGPGLWQGLVLFHKCSLAMRDRISLMRTTSFSCCSGLLSMALCSLAM